MSDTLDLQDAALCVDRIARFQTERNLSDLALVRELPSLGSARTWRSRLAVMDWSAAPLSIWLTRLHVALRKIEGRGDGADAPNGAPIALVQRHLAEADRCRRESAFYLARSHCLVARQAIEAFQRTLHTSPKTLNPEAV